MSCSRKGQPCKKLPGWTWYHWPSSRGDNRYLQHSSGVVALSLFDARKEDVLHKKEGSWP